MDATFLTELLECSVCLEQLDGNSRVLPCQHTFCKRCLQEIVQSKGELRCPECRTLVETRVDDLPLNIFLVRLLEGIKNKTPRKCLVETSMQAACTTPTVASALSGILYNTQCATPSGVFCAKAIYQYESTNTSDLSFQKGDLINLIKRIDVNWYQGEMKGKVGFVPASYITIITPLSQSQAIAKALYDFQITDKSSEEKECLAFNKGEMIHVIRRVDENWAEGRIGDRSGIFPISFVEMNLQAKQLIKMITCTGPSKLAPPTPSPANLSSSMSDSGAKTPDLAEFSMTAENKRHSLSALNLSPSQPLVTPTSSTSEHRHSMEILSGDSPLVSTNKPCTGQISNAQTLSHNKLLEINATVRRQPRPKEDSALAHMFYVALYNYKPQKDDELELKKGEVYTVSEKCQDGWYKGSSLKTGSQGVFPGNYVQPAAKSSQQPSSYYPMVPVPAGTQQLLTGFGGMCASPMRPRSNPQVLNGRDSSALLYAQRSSEWPLQAAVSNSFGNFGDVFVSSAQQPVTMMTTSMLNSKPHGGQMTQYSRQINSLAVATQSLSNTNPWLKDAQQVSSNSSTAMPTNPATVIPQHLSLIKRLTRHKSKSPPPALGLEANPPVHIRSGSCPSSHSSPAGPSACSTTGLHKKTASLDDALASPSPSPSPQSLQQNAEQFRCMVPCPPNSDYELELKVGDVVYVHKKRDDGWYRGTLQRTGRTGLFPASFVDSYSVEYQNGQPAVSLVSHPSVFRCVSPQLATQTHILNPPQ